MMKRSTRKAVAAILVGASLFIGMGVVVEHWVESRRRKTLIRELDRLYTDKLQTSEGASIVEGVREWLSVGDRCVRVRQLAEDPTGGDASVLAWGVILAGRCPEVLDSLQYRLNALNNRALAGDAESLYHLDDFLTALRHAHNPDVKPLLWKLILRDDQLPDVRLSACSSLRAYADTRDIPQFVAAARGGLFKDCPSAARFLAQRLFGTDAVITASGGIHEESLGRILATQAADWS